jgi:uncharacterized protein (TIGR02646 family)
MHKVKRNSCPSLLAKKHDEWISALTDTANLSHDWNNLNKKTKFELQEALREMYGGCCCYYESLVEHSSYFNIEHFRHKSDYPELCYEYGNLHYSCQIYNNLKCNKFIKNIVENN